LTKLICCWRLFENCVADCRVSAAHLAPTQTRHFF